MLGQRLNPEQIKASFGLCERAVKRLIRDYFVQFDEKFIARGKGPVLKNGKPLDPALIPQEYKDQAAIMKLVHGNSERNQFDTTMLKFDSLLKIPDTAGHLTVPLFKVGADEPEIWTLGLHLGAANAAFDKTILEEFAKLSVNPEQMQTLVLQLMGGFYPSASVVFDFLKKQHTNMQTLSLGYNQSVGAIVLIDNRFPGLVPNKRLIVKLQPASKKLKNDNV